MSADYVSLARRSMQVAGIGDPEELPKLVALLTRQRVELELTIEDLRMQLADTVLHAETYKGECRESEATLTALRAAAQRAWDEVSGKDDVDYAELELLAVAIEASKRRVIAEPGKEGIG